MNTIIVKLIILSSAMMPSDYFLTELERRVESMSGADIRIEPSLRSDPAPWLNDDINLRVERLYSLRKISPKRSKKIIHYLTPLMEGFWFAGRAPVCLYSQSYPASFSTIDNNYEELSIRAAAQEIGHDLGLVDGPPCTGMDDKVLSCAIVDYSLQRNALRRVKGCQKRRK